MITLTAVVDRRVGRSRFSVLNHGSEPLGFYIWGVTAVDCPF